MQELLYILHDNYATKVLFITYMHVHVFDVMGPMILLTQAGLCVLWIVLP